MDISRKTAFRVLMDIDTRSAYSNLALNRRIESENPDAPAFVRRLVYGVLEKKMTYDYFIDCLVKNGIGSLKPAEINIIRMGMFQLAEMDSVPEYAAINESVQLAKKYCKGKAGLVNGVLRSFQKRNMEIAFPDREKDELKYLSVKYSCEPWIIGLWLQHYDTGFVEELLAAGNEEPPMTVRTNSLKVRREDLVSALNERGIEAVPGTVCTGAINLKAANVLDSDFYVHGLFTPQDESSMLVAELLDPKEGELIMDVCAAPGGKTCAIAEKMANTGKVIASDVYPRKLEQIKREAVRLGIENIETRPWDATRVDASMVGKADRVLVDAPCSGLGVMRRKPEIKYKEKPEQMQFLPQKQFEILTSSAAYVKAGGTLVYSTCTINPDENERVVEKFTGRDSSFSITDSRQLLPNVDGTDGFFICVMKREGDKNQYGPADRI